MRKLVIPYQNAKSLLQNGDVLLFRSRGIIPFFIQKAGYSNYNHVGMLDKVDDSTFKIIEFREFKGFQEVPLDIYINVKCTIDVFRPKSSFIQSYLVINADTDKYHIKSEEIKYKPEDTILLFKTMNKMPYGWERIAIMMIRHIPFLRLFISPEVDDLSEPNYIYPVCSTAVATCLRKTYIDPVPTLADYCVEPGDLGRSLLFDYLFTIGV